MHMYLNTTFPRRYKSLILCLDFRFSPRLTVNRARESKKSFEYRFKFSLNSQLICDRKKSKMMTHKLLRVELSQ